MVSQSSQAVLFRNLVVFVEAFATAAAGGFDEGDDEGGEGADEGGQADGGAAGVDGVEGAGHADESEEEAETEAPVGAGDVAEDDGALHFAAVVALGDELVDQALGKAGYDLVVLAQEVGWGEGAGVVLADHCGQQFAAHFGGAGFDELDDGLGRQVADDGEIGVDGEGGLASYGSAASGVGGCSGSRPFSRSKTLRARVVPPGSVL